jgi:hypothetical protein
MTHDQDPDDRNDDRDLPFIIAVVVGAFALAALGNAFLWLAQQG